MSKGIYFYTPDFQTYDLGPLHPLKPTRISRTHDLLQAYGALDHVTVEVPRPASAEDLRAIHDAEYVECVERLSTGEHVPFPFRYGFGPGDNPVFPGMWEASCLYTGASQDAADAVNSGRCMIAMNTSGGLHHAHRDRAAGFCVFNDCAIAVHRMRQHFARVAYVDIDVHHGDGVEEAFYGDPSVLTVSIHETGETLFPGTGFVEEMGVGPGAGYSVNLPMWPFTTDDIWISAWRKVGLPILKAFRPDAICLQLGADAHYLDPLARLSITAQGWLEAVKDVKALGLPIVAVGGGGYNPTTVPRMWALAFSVLFDVPLPDDTPESFGPRGLIPTLTDHETPPVAPHDAARARDYAQDVIAEAHRVLFPLHGLSA